MSRPKKECDSPRQDPKGSMFAWIARSHCATFLEIAMKTKYFIRSLTALCAVTAVGSAFAAAGYTHPTEGWVSSNLTRAEVMSELRDAKSNGSAASSRIDGDENL